MNGAPYNKDKKRRNKNEIFKGLNIEKKSRSERQKNKIKRKFKKIGEATYKNDLRRMREIKDGT